MNILMVCYPTYGGSGVVATELGKVLADRGHTVHFVTYQQPVRLPSFNANLLYHEVRVPTYPLFDYPPYESALSSMMVDVTTNYNIDLIHVHYAIPHASAAYMAQQMLKSVGKNIPFITTLHGTDITLVGKDITYNPIVTFSMNNSNALTAVSKSLREDTFKNFSIDIDIEVIYNFVDLKQFHKKPNEAYKKMLAPNGEKIIIHASNFRKVKRVGDVVKVYQKIVKEVPAVLLMIGDGPERPDLEEQVRNCPSRSKIKFLGKQETIEDILSMGDLFMLPSEHESFGLSALEALAAEVPVIGTNSGGLPEVVENGYCGYLSSIGDVDDMAQHSLYLLKNDDVHQQFKHNAYTQAKKFTIDTIVPQYENLYLNTINKGVTNL